MVKVWNKDERKIARLRMTPEDYATALEHQIDSLISGQELIDTKVEIARREGWNQHADFLDDHFSKAIQAALAMMATHYCLVGIIIGGDGELRVGLLRKFLPDLGAVLTSMKAENERVANYIKAEFQIESEGAFETDFSMRFLELLIGLYSEDKRKAGVAERTLRAFIEESDIVRDALRLKIKFKDQHAKPQVFKRDEVISRLCDTAHPYFEEFKRAPKVVEKLYEYFYSQPTLTDSEVAQLELLERWDAEDGDAARNLRLNYDNRYKRLP